MFNEVVQVSHYSGTVLEENHYYPFGLTISESSNNPTLPKQPYKYQGKELERSFGIETFDFDARQVDPQIGRFNSIDPHADRYVSISPFVSMNNSPANYIDPNGKDVRVGYQKDDNGNTTITLSSTIYVRGYQQAEKTKEYNEFVQNNPQLLTNTTANEDGTTTTTKIDIQYKEATNEDVVRLTNPESRNGDNLMNIGADYGRSSATPIKEKNVNPSTGEVSYKKSTDYLARIGGKDKHYSSAKTAFHESMHLFGLKDWYNNGADQKTVGFYDIMNNHTSTNTLPILHQTHWNSWNQGVEQQYQQNGGLRIFISKQIVEND